MVSRNDHHHASADQWLRRKVGTEDTDGLMSLLDAEESSMSLGP